MTRKNEDVLVKITKLTVVENSGATVARFDYAIKMGDYVQECRGNRLTETMFETRVRPYSSKFTGSNNQEIWHDKARINNALEFKLIAEVRKALEFAKDNELKELKAKELKAMYE